MYSNEDILKYLTNWSNSIEAGTTVILLVASGAGWHYESPAVDGGSGIIESWI